MEKNRAQISVYSDDWERFKQQTDNASEELREFIKSYLQRDDSKQKRIEQINEEIEEKKSEIAKGQKQISNLQAERDNLQRKIEQEKQTSKEKMEFFEETLARHYQEGNWTCPDDIPVFWTNEFDLDKQEIWEQARSYLELDMEVRSQ
jgi:chromosome segregation ATPase